VIDSSHPLVTGAWKYLNGHLVKLIDSCGFNSSSPNWKSMQEKWIEALEPSVLAELIILDVYSEVSNPDPCVSRGGRWAMNILLDPSESDSRYQVLRKLQADLPEGLVRPKDTFPPPPLAVGDAPPPVLNDGNPPESHGDNDSSDNQEDQEAQLSDVGQELLDHLTKKNDNPFVDVEAEEADEDDDDDE